MWLLIQFVVMPIVEIALILQAGAQIGFWPTFPDRRVVTFELSEPIAGPAPFDLDLFDGADRVFVAGDGIFREPWLERMGEILSEQGFIAQETEYFEWVEINVWVRPGGVAASDAS